MKEQARTNWVAGTETVGGAADCHSISGFPAVEGMLQKPITKQKKIVLMKDGFIRPSG